MNVIVYQGYNEHFRVRVVDDDGNALLNSELMEDQADAIKLAEVLADKYGVKEIDVHETIQDVAEREAREAEAKNG